MKKLYLLLFFISFLGISDAYDLNAQELSSLRWLITQYQINSNWNMTATDCADINKGAGGSITCGIDQSGFQTITALLMVTSTWVDHGEPPVIDKLIFPNLQTFLLSAGQHKNASYSLLGLLDNTENVNLNRITVQYLSLASVPTFPSKLKLTTLVLTEVTMISDLNLNLIFKGVNSSLNFQRISFTSTFKMFLDISTMTKSTLSTMFEQNGMLNFTNSYFDTLSDITINDISNTHPIVFGSSTLYRIDIDNAMVVLGDLPKVRNFKAKNCAFSTSDFSVLPSLSDVIFDNISTPIENASGLFNVVITNSPVPIVPSESWFSNSFSLKLENTSSSGQLPDFKSFDSVSISIYGTQNIKTELYDSFCRFNLDITSTTLVGNVADCFYCYWSEMKSKLPSNTPNPPNDFKCNISLDSYKYVIPQIVNTEYGSSNLTFSTIQNYTLQIYWGLELSVYLIQSENIDGNNVLIKAFGKFNLKAPLAIKATNFGNSNCQITYNTTTQFNCIIPNQNSTNPILINLDDTITTINYYSSSTLLISGVHFKINNQDVEISANFGPNPYNVSAIISNFPCQQTLLNDSILSCRLPVGLVENVYYSLLVYANGYNQTIPVFIKPKEDCGSQSNCNGHGSCFDGKCRCNDGYSGYYCESQLSPGVVILPNNTIPSPTVIVKDGMNFTFNIIAIQEIDELSSVVRELKTNKWIHSTTGNETFSITTYSLQSTTPEVDQINATIEYSKNSRLINFAGQSTLYPENSLKLMVTINNWSYKDRLNRLRLLMESISSINNNDDGCSELDISVNNGTEVNFLRMTINDVSFYGRFLPYALSDDKPVLIQNQVVNQTKESILSGMTLTYCDRCVIDPDFSVLINTDVKSDCKEKFATWKIVTIVVVLSVVILAAGLGVFFVLKKKYKYRKEQKRIGNKLNKLS
ncbi:Epidermal growth factor-related protein 1 [Heterostelium album PN500]|uniref:Epidermal growth factor-related protein 1 n=1 Tax=Heterostelium pallidum (strain ATCC 26659 / Pp 5 / PN500) TaxID=670386 RepID=D3BDQ9_HETP5|nr:Epidermal growth factor-related protein 1 [Heterostelium album PN500]EFA80040.1 Epidermal growth factor-related protein 1 [Heterostelium album PN500]|eukprot:XP_020432160.1 Epidermal growth factor-related protein 1 [Heterostelium album PN500]